MIIQSNNKLCLLINVINKHTVTKSQLLQFVKLSICGKTVSDLEYYIQPFQDL